MLGILLIDKPLGCTSHDVVNRLRRTFGTKRVGHAGTLDPMATGLLVVAVGSATRFLQYLPLEPKEYVGEITFGQTSSTYDAEGELSAPVAVPVDLVAQLRSLTSKFTGLIEQTPPMYSAVKVAGKPLYAYARQGQDAERKSRTVHVETIEFESVSTTVVQTRIVCSGGTYVRTIADDLGRAIGVGAFLSGLRRIRAGEFTVEEAVSLDEASLTNLRTLADALPPMPLVSLNETQAFAIRQGRRLGWANPPAGRLAGLLDPGGSVLGVARIEGEELQPECVIPLEAGI